MTELLASHPSQLLPVDRDAILTARNLPRELYDAPIVPDFDGRHHDFLAWANQLSIEEKELALARCSVDQLYFCDNWTWFRSVPLPALWPRGMAPPPGIRQLKCYESQAEYLVESDPWYIIHGVKIRQWGFTTIEDAKAAREANFLDNQFQAHFSLDRERAEETVTIIKTILDHLPPWLATGQKGKPAKHHIELLNGSYLKSMATRDTGGVSGAYTRINVDEIALIEQKRHIDLTEMIEVGAYPALESHGGRYSGFSTGRSRAGFFWNTAKRLHPDLGGYQKPYPEEWRDEYLAFIPASKHPIWCDDALYLRNMQASSDPAKFRRERPKRIQDAFSASGLSAFDGDALERRSTAVAVGYDPINKLRHPRGQNVRFTLDKRWGNVLCKHVGDGLEESRKWRNPVAGHRYVISCDPSRGGPATRSFCAGIVLDVDTGEVVCVVHGRFRTAPEFMRYMELVAYHYNTGLLVWECNVDKGAIKQVLEDQYPNLYYRPIKEGQDQALDEPSLRVGWETTGKNRSMILSALKEEFIGEWLLIYDTRVIEECSTFITYITNETTGSEREQASAGARDDLVMALAIAVYVAREQPDICESMSNPEENQNVGFVNFSTDPNILVSSYEGLLEPRGTSDAPENRARPWRAPAVFNWPESAIGSSHAQEPQEEEQNPFTRGGNWVPTRARGR